MPKSTASLPLQLVHSLVLPYVDSLAGGPLVDIVRPNFHNLICFISPATSNVPIVTSCWLVAYFFLCQSYFFVRCKSLSNH
ncbi:hypothetical protein EDB19DRAFT_1687525, partial [Suillus lakei]